MHVRVRTDAGVLFRHPDLCGDTTKTTGERVNKVLDLWQQLDKVVQRVGTVPCGAR